MKKKVSIVIVNYKSDKDTLECIKLIGNFKNFEIIVVDNGGSTNLQKNLKKLSDSIKYIKSENYGYGAGNNLGVKNSNGEFVLVLNPDVLIKKKDIEVLVGILQRDKKVAAVGPNLIHPNGKIFDSIGTGRLTPITAVFSHSLIHKLWPNNKISKDFWLKDIAKNKAREVDSIPGSVFMIRRDVFEKVGGFDENMFLYFEEHDLGKRIIDNGYKLVISPEAKAVHKWRNDGQKSKKINKIFSNSRYYYLRKHFGITRAFIAESICRISFYDLAFLIIFLLGAFLRFYHLKQNFLFHGELGHVYVELKNFIEQKTIPLVGPQTSHPWMHFGPLYYWLLIPIFILSNFNPFAPTVFMAFISCSIVVFNYIYMKKWFSKASALISTLLIAVSYPFIQVERGSMLFSVVPLIFYPFIDSFFLSLENKKYIFWTFLYLGIMLNFHLSAIILIPTILLYNFLLGNAKSKYFWKASIAGLAIPHFTLLLQDAKDGFLMTRNFLLWIPYRIAGFLGFYPKNTLTENVVHKNFIAIYRFFGEIIASGNMLFSIIFILVIISGFKIFFSKPASDSIKKLKIFYVFLALGLTSIFIHGDPPNHYFLPLYSIPLIIIGSVAKKTKNIVYIAMLVVIFITAFNNFKYVFRSYLPNRGKAILYQDQISLTKIIIQDANGSTYQLRRIGQDDQFDFDFAQNYQFLLWRLGNEPVVVGEDVVESEYEPIYKYTLVEDETKLSDRKIFETGGVSIYKTEISKRL